MIQQMKHADNGFENLPALPLCTRAVLRSPLCKQLVVVAAQALCFCLKHAKLTGSRKNVGWGHLLSLWSAHSRATSKARGGCSGSCSSERRLQGRRPHPLAGPCPSTAPLSWVSFLRLMGIFFAAPRAHCLSSFHCALWKRLWLYLLDSPPMRELKPVVRLP